MPDSHVGHEYKLISMNPQELAQQAWSCLQSNRLAEAKDMFARLAAVDPQNAEAWMMLGTLQGAFGELEAALAALQRALDLEPGCAQAHLGQGKIRLIAGQLDAALASLRQAVRCDAGLVDAWLLLGGLHNRMDRFREAEAASRRALDLQPGSLEARLHLANALLARNDSVPEADRWLPQPVFVTGIPRSGTSLVTGCLAACGAWAGNTLPGNASNPTGYFENAAVREGVLKAQLRQLDADPLGVKQLPPLSGQPPQPRLGAQLLTLFTEQGYTETGPWLYKDAKLTLVWPVWRSAFPHARWVIVRRPTEAILDSCLRTDFMRQHSDSPEFWRRWVRMYEQRLEILKASGAWWREIDAQRLIAEGAAALQPLVSDLGLSWNAEGVADLVRPQHWHARTAPAVVTRPEPSARPPLIVNSVPKSGTHLLGKLVALLGYSDVPLRLYNNFAPRSMQVEETRESVRVGSVWPSLAPLERLGETFLQVRSSQYIQGHLPYSARLLQLMDVFGMRMILVLRDPRDVAVSHANWVPGRDFLASHEFYQGKSAEECLRLAITGYCIEPEGPLELGMRARFEHMLPWLDQPGVYTTRFEWLAGERAGGSAELQLRELRNISTHLGLEADEGRLKQVAEQLYGGTMTFKGGQIGAWQGAFSEAHKRLIMETMGDIIVRLGYAVDPDW